MADRILAFVPCYNCEAQIGRTLAQFAGPAGARVAEVLVLDNGSRDGTVAAALAAARAIPSVRVTIARNRANYGLGGSHKAAFAHAAREGFSHVAVLHGDDQGRIDDLLPIVDSGAHRARAACFGARFMPGARLPGYSPARIHVNRAFNALITTLTGERVYDLGSGLNIFGRAIFAHEGARRWSDDLRFNVYLLLDVIARELPVLWFPIEWREEDQVSNARIASQGARTLAMLGGYTFRPNAFFAADHRAVRHASYAFDSVH